MRLYTQKGVYPSDHEKALNLVWNESVNNITIAICSFKEIEESHVMIYLMIMKDRPIFVFNLQANYHVCTLRSAQEHC